VPARLARERDHITLAPRYDQRATRDTDTYGAFRALPTDGHGHGVPKFINTRARRSSAGNPNYSTARLDLVGFVIALIANAKVSAEIERWQ